MGRVFTGEYRCCLRLRLCGARVLCLLALFKPKAHPHTPLVPTVSLGDLKENGEDDAFRKFKLKVEEVNGTQCLTNFYGMDMSTDKLRSLVRKWHSLIEAYVDVKTTDGYTLRLFCIGFTKRRNNQSRKTSYAQSGQIRQIRKKMVDIMTREATSCDLQQLVAKLIPEVIGREIEKATQGIYPLQNVLIRKVGRT